MAGNPFHIDTDLHTSTLSSVDTTVCRNASGLIQKPDPFACPPGRAKGSCYAFRFCSSAHAENDISSVFLPHQAEPGCTPRPVPDLFFCLAARGWGGIYSAAIHVSPRRAPAGCRPASPWRREAPGRGQAAPPASGAAYASRGPAGHAPRTNCPQSETCFFPCCHTPSPAETSGAKLASVQRELMILPPSPSPQRFCLRPRRDRAPSRCRVRRRPQCASTSRFLPGGSGSATPRPACREAG